MVIFPSLHLNSEYSLLESTIKIDSLINFAGEKGLKSLVITDHNVMSGVAEFVYKCKKNNIKPIVGLDLDVQDFRLIFLAKNYLGYQELIKLSSKKVVGETIYLKNIQTTNLYVIDHPRLGYFATKQRQLELENYFVGVDETELLPNGVFVQETKILNEKENKALMILDSIKNNGNMPTKNFQFQAYKYKGEIDNPLVKQAIVIIENCNIVFPKVGNITPHFTPPNNLSSLTYFKQLINKGFQKYLGNNETLLKYVIRIKHEIETIDKLGFINYFLIIWDVVSWAKEQQIIIGPGRGSSVGSLAAYLLGITEVDPIKFDLIFERFLNPERVSMPDIDIDIEDIRRDEVINYLFDKYGEKKVALISTFQKLGAKMSLRDCAKAMKIPIRDVDTISGFIKLNTSLDKAYLSSSRFRAAIDRSSQYTELFHNAKLIEGLPRQSGTHPSGIVMLDKDLDLIVPTTKGPNSKNQVQYSMNYLEENGLLKIDLLGLKNLNIIKRIQEEIQISSKEKINLKNIPLNDRRTNELFSSVNTNGIFQFESYGMKNTLAKIKVDSIEDVIAIISLYRPGPMDYIDVYARRKKGIKNVELISQEYDLVVKPTYGIIIYQEQIMKIAQVFSGMSFAQADILRRAISKKEHGQIKSLKNKFITGAQAKGYDEAIINKVFTNIEKFANYGFNRSHAVAYGILSYRIAFLKVWFPLEFYIVLLESSIGSQTSMKKYINEAKAKKINVIAPDVTMSQEKVFNYQKNIILPLNIIKGLGDVANNKLTSERKQGDFKNFFNFVSRVRCSGVGEPSILLLIQVGALRKFGNVQTLIDALPSAIRYASMITITKNNQKTIDESIIIQPKIINQESNLKLEIAYQIKLFGFKLSVFETMKYEKVTKIININPNGIQTVILLIEKIKKFTDKNGNQMAKVIVSDSTNQIEISVWSQDWKFVMNTKIGTIVEATILRKEFHGTDSYSLKKPWKKLNV